MNIAASQNADRRGPGWSSVVRSAGLMLTVSLLLTILFWGPIWSGYGFIGGDLYPYFFPQKAFLADRLHAGEFPLWNNLTGFGYPVLGESQTGAAYPLHLIAYDLLDVNTAYNVEHLLHYIICFGGVWLFGQRLRLGMAGSLLAAIVFTYGWFPPRACLEWAIVTGAWLPVALWCVESFVQTRWWRYAIGLSLVLGLQLLAGHFHLAFITQMLVVAYGAWRLWAVSSRIPVGSVAVARPESSRGLMLALLLSVVAGFLIASVQLLPAWELKTRSSRATIGGEHEPSYGHLPPLYVSQMVAPWKWYNPRLIEANETVRTVAELGAPWHWYGPDADQDQLLMKSRAGGLTNIATNKVEAHLYCGLAPLGLAVWWLLWRCRRSATGDAPVPLRGESLFWAIAGILALVYATGWLLPIARHIPGFNFFRGPGRYGIVTTLAIALLAGRALCDLLRHRAVFGQTAIIGLVLWSTIGDLWLVSRMVKYAEMVPKPPILARDQSPVRKRLLAEPLSPRLYAPMQNLPTLTGVSCLPVYLGISPEEYADPKFAGSGMPRSDQVPLPPDETFSRWLRDNGVTHLLTEKRLDEPAWKVEPLWQGFDPLISRAMGRFEEPLYLYRLQGSVGRVSLLDDVAGAATAKLQRDANRFVVETDSPGPATLLFRDLQYPGWQVQIDGKPVEGRARSPFREVGVPEGKHTVTWTYRPFSVKLGLLISTITLMALAAIGHVRFWHRERLDGILSRWFPARW
jgi:hypothetical protein